MAFSVDGDYIAVGGLKSRLHIFSLADGQLHYSITTPSPIKALVWLPGAEQTLVCACHSGILINIIVRPGVSTRFDLRSGPSHTYCNTKVTMNLSCFRAQHHTVEFMAVDTSTCYLATGSGLDVRVWKGDKHRMSSYTSLRFIYLHIC